MPGQTGPRTRKGKAISRLNAAKSGLYSESPVLPGVEDEDEWLAHRRALFEAIAPANYLEEALTEVEDEVVLHHQDEAAGIIDDLGMVASAQKRELSPEMSQEDSELIGRWLMDRLIPGEKELSLLMRYEGRLHRHLLQLLHELEAMKARRRGESTPLLRVDAQGIADIAGS